MTIRRSFTLALTAVGAVLFGLYALWAYWTERDDLRGSAVAEVRLVGQSLETSLGNALRDRQGSDVDETLGALEAVAPDVDIHVLGPDGQPIARSRGAVAGPELLAFGARAATSRRDAVAFEPAGARDRVVFAGPLTGDDGTVLGSVVVAHPTAELHADLARTRDRLLVALIALVVATGVVGLLLGAVYVSRPIAGLLTAVQHVRAGDFRSQVPVGRRDEIGALVVEFNAMLAALDDSRVKVEHESAARANLEQGLQRVDKLVTIGQLSAGLAHEIGSPLQVLVGRAAVLTEHADPEVRRQAGVLVAQCDRIVRVIEQLLSFGRRKAPRCEPCELDAPVRAVIELLHSEALRHGIALTLAGDDRPHRIVGDADQLQQVALNLIRNALAVTPRRGTIAVSLEHAGDRQRLRVRDSGPGIDADTQAHLFEPFFTTRASSGGTGLGLAVVRTIVDEHRGTIEVRSEPGHGAEFVVSFPSAMEVSLV